MCGLTEYISVTETASSGVTRATTVSHLAHNTRWPPRTSPEKLHTVCALRAQVRILCKGVVETIGRLQVDGHAKMTAHPKVDPETGWCLRMYVCVCIHVYWQLGIAWVSEGLEVPGCTWTATRR